MTLTEEEYLLVSTTVLNALVAQGQAHFKDDEWYMGNTRLILKKSIT